jgi:hypothetical protein
MAELAGYAAENQFHIENRNTFVCKNPDWHADLLVRLESDCEGDNDVSRARTLAVSLCGAPGGVRKSLRRLAAWTDEALRHPRLWAVVVALAERLQTVDGELPGDEARAVMAQAWGGQGGFPYLDMGLKWRRRFGTQGEKGR